MEKEERNFTLTSSQASFSSFNTRLVWRGVCGTSIDCWRNRNVSQMRRSSGIIMTCPDYSQAKDAAFSHPLERLDWRVLVSGWWLHHKQSIISLAGPLDCVFCQIYESIFRYDPKLCLYSSQTGDLLTGTISGLHHCCWLFVMTHKIAMWLSKCDFFSFFITQSVSMTTRVDNHAVKCINRLYNPPVLLIHSGLMIL